jgi:hypothetical protein
MDSIRAKKPHIKLENGWWLCDNSVGISPVRAYESWHRCREMQMQSWSDFMKKHRLSIRREMSSNMQIPERILFG